MKYIFIAITFLFIANSGLSQNVTNEIIIHKDKPIYFIGDVAAYKVYLPKDVFETGTVFNVRLTSTAGDQVQSHFVKVDDDATIEGFFTLPFTYAADVYQAEYFIFNESTQKEVSVAHTWIPLYDDLEPNIDRDAVANASADVVLSNVTDWEVSGDDNIKIGIKETDINGSISIQKKQDIPYSAYSKSAYGAKGSYSKKLFFTGTLTDLSGNVLTNRLIATYQAQNDMHKILKTNEDGIFFVQMDDFVEERSVQVIDLGTNPVITKVEPTISGVTEKRPPLVFTDGIVELLRRKKEQRRINKYFNAKTKNVKLENAVINIVEEEETPKKKSKPYKPDNTYVFNDYKIFDDFAIFANEVTQNLIFRLKNKMYESNYVFYITTGNYRNVGKEVFLNPFFIIDGKITRDADYIGRLSQPLLDKVELEYEPKKTREKYSLFGKEGIVRLYSKTGNLPIPQEELGSIVNIGGLQDRIVLSNHLAGDTPGPVLDDFPYWQADLTGTMEVVKPSDRGEYEVILVSRKEAGSKAITISKKSYIAN